MTVRPANRIVVSVSHRIAFMQIMIRRFSSKERNKLFWNLFNDTIGSESCFTFLKFDMEMSSDHVNSCYSTNTLIRNAICWYLFHNSCFFFIFSTCHIYGKFKSLTKGVTFKQNRICNKYIKTVFLISALFQNEKISIYISCDTFTVSFVILTFERKLSIKGYWLKLLKPLILMYRIYITWRIYIKYRNVLYFI